MRFDFSFFSRKKKYDSIKLEQTNLSRVLNLIDLSGLGIACTLGSGIYVLAGTVISQYSGPAVIISFIIAGITSFLSGLSYAELGARVPRSGSAYIYIYVTIGEFIAFVIGWDVTLEYVIGTSSTASALSQYIDSLCNNAISNAFNSSMHIHTPGLADYPDWLAFGLSLIVTGLLVIGVKESSFLNKMFTALNLAVISFIIICGATKANGDNWRVVPNDNLSWTDDFGQNQTCASAGTCGTGGFAPYGFSGIIGGAAKCFYAFIGFDCIATTGEEVKNPKRTIPLSIIITLCVVATSYILSSLILTLMIPYYMLDPDVPLTQAFNYVHLHWASYVVAIGAIASLATCLYASMFPMPRVVYSMAQDGLIFKFLGWVMPYFKTPVAASIFTGVFSAILALIFDLNQLIDMMSVGTLLAYSLVSACNLVLRYRPSTSIEETKEKMDFENNEPTKRQKRSVKEFLFGKSDQPLLKRLVFPADKTCNMASAQLVVILTIVAVLLIIALDILLNQLDLTQAYAIVIVVLLAVIIVLLTFFIWRQPQDRDIKTFKIPLMPLSPIVSIFVNVYLMTTLEYQTWIRFGVWFVIGIFMYFGYAIRKSKERVKTPQQFRLFPCIEFNSKKVPANDSKTEITASQDVGF